MNEISKLKSEVDRLKLNINDQDNGISHKAKQSLLEYENLFLKEEIRNKQLVVSPNHLNNDLVYKIYRNHSLRSAALQMNHHALFLKQVIGRDLSLFLNIRTQNNFE